MLTTRIASQFLIATLSIAVACLSGSARAQGEAPTPAPVPVPAEIAGVKVPALARDLARLQAEEKRALAEANRRAKSEPLAARRNATRGGYLRGLREAVSGWEKVESEIEKLRKQQRGYAEAGATEKATVCERDVAKVTRRVQEKLSVAALRDAAARGPAGPGPSARRDVPGSFAPFLASLRPGDDRPRDVAKRLAGFVDEMVRLKTESSPEIGERASAEAKEAQAIIDAIEKGDLAEAQSRLDTKWQEIMALPE